MTKANERYRAASCEGKHRFLTWEEARRVAKHDHDKARYPYHCKFCSGFHLGTDKMPRENKRPRKQLEAE